MDRRTLIFVALMVTSFYLINNFFFPSPTNPPATPKNTSEIIKPIASALDEKLYVIENKFQQLVISNRNGAISEINLPFRSETNPDSVVRMIREDETLKKNYPEFDQFPRLAPENVVKGRSPQQTGGYYPLLRRGIAPQYYSMAILSSDLKSAQTIFEVKKIEENSIELEGIIDQTRIKKTYVLPKNPDQTPYVFDVFISIEGPSQGLNLASGVTEAEIISGKYTPFLKYRITRHQKSVIENLSLPKSLSLTPSIVPEWIANSNGFFTLIIDPQNEMNAGFTIDPISGESVPTRLSIIDRDHDLYPAHQYKGYNIHIPFKTKGDQYHFRVFAGPLASTILEKVDDVYHRDYISIKKSHGWFSFISEPFAKFLFFLMKIFYSVVHSWGIAIILLTIALRLMLYPLNAWSIKSTVKMQKLSPKIHKLQERYKKDPKKAQIEMLNLYREYGVNPLGGCLPLFIQMPFLIGMFDLLKSTFELRGASFIPGWIPNLAAPDVIFTWSTPIWLIGNSLHLLPLLQGAVMLIQQRMSSTSSDASSLTDQQKQQRLMGNMMVVIFTALFYHFPSGLNIYWMSSMLLGILQQWWMSRKIKLKT